MNHDRVIDHVVKGYAWGGTAGFKQTLLYGVSGLALALAMPKFEEDENE
jgi:hypothetical protein